MLVFVYGTLRKTGRFNHLLENAQFIDIDSINAQMFFYPAGYPYIFLNSSYTVTGEIYKIDDTTLSTLDRLEGYRPNDKFSYYQRTLITTHKNHQVFVYSRNTHPSNNIIPIESGDWIQFISHRK